MARRKSKFPTVSKKLLCFVTEKKNDGINALYHQECLPALELDGRIITESDDILMALEAAFGPLTHSMKDQAKLSLYGS
jgi:glutathione S-transferase